MTDLGLFDAKPLPLWDGIYTRRYQLYARSHGMTAAEMADAEQGRAYRFSLWLQEKWREYDGEHGIRSGTPRSDAMQADFDAWLEG